MKYKELNEQIIKYVGGVGNVESLTHCITRLRFHLKDDSKADANAIKKLKGVTSCVNKSGQFQVVIGTAVSDVYDEMVETYHIGEGSGGSSKGKMNLFAMLCDTMSSIVMPMIGPLAGAGMIKAILSILVTFSLIDKTSQTYQIFYMVADGVFYYMPFFLAFSAGKKFKCNPYLSLVFAGMLVNPTYVAFKAAGEAVHLLGLPVTLATYTSSVVPIILIVYFQSKIEKLITKICPKPVKVFVVPMVVLLITVPVGLVALGPVGSICGTYIAKFFTLLNDYAGWLVPMLIGAFTPLLVMTGMHYAIGSAQSVQRATMGYATIMAPGMVCSNMAQSAAAFGVALRTKNKEMKSLASSVGVTALCGITEPVLYGVSMKLKRPLYATMIGGAVGGLYAGIMNVKQWAYGTSTIFALPVYIGEDSSFVNIIIAVVIAMVVGFVVSFIIHTDKNIETEEEMPVTAEPTGKELTEKVEIYAPVSGKVIPLEEVKDDAFNTEALGKGCAIVPENGEIVSPINGTVEMIFETKHAIGLKSDSGAEVLIHIGMDTVKLNGKYFTAHVKNGDKVTVGTPLVSFDIEQLKKEDYDVTTPVIITNSAQYLDVVELTFDNVKAKDMILTVVK